MNEPWLKPWSPLEEMMNPQLIKFWDFHRANPAVFAMLRMYALVAKERKRGQYSISVITEIIRWHVDIETSGSEFKLCNSHRAYYARLLMLYEPELEGFFNIKKVHGEDAWWKHKEPLSEAA